MRPQEQAESQLLFHRQETGGPGGDRACPDRTASTCYPKPGRLTPRCVTSHRLLSQDTHRPVSLNPNPEPAVKVQKSRI